MALRCFIAVALPPPLKQSVDNMVKVLKNAGGDVKWVPSENLHLTLKFLGATEEEKVDDIIAELRRKLSPYPRFYIRISGVGSFPGGRHPRVIWVGIREQGRLEDIYGSVEEAVKEFGYLPEDRPFAPHLTVGRVRSGKGLGEVLKRLDQFRSADFAEVEVRGVTLMKSELKPGGPVYSSLAEIPLEGKNGG